MQPRDRPGEGVEIVRELRDEPWAKPNPAQEAHLVELWDAGKHTCAELAELFSVARSTVYRAVQRAGKP